MPGPGDDILMVPTGKSIGTTYAVMSKPISAGNEILLLHSRDGKTYGYKPSQIFAGDSILLAPVKGDKRMIVGLTDYPDFVAGASWTAWADYPSWATSWGSGGTCTCQCYVFGTGRYNSGTTVRIPIRAYCNRQMFSYQVGGSQWVTNSNPPKLLGYAVGYSTPMTLGGGFHGASGTWYGSQELHKGDTWTCSFSIYAEAGGYITPGDRVDMHITGIYLWRV